MIVIIFILWIAIALPILNDNLPRYERLSTGRQFFIVLILFAGSPLFQIVGALEVLLNILGGNDEDSNNSV